MTWRMRAPFTLFSIRHYSRISPPPPAVIRVSEKNVTHLGPLKTGPKPRQLLSLPPFPGHNLPGKHWGQQDQVTAISWIKYYFDEVKDSVIQSHFNKGLVQMECANMGDSFVEQGLMKPMTKIKPNKVMEAWANVYIPVSVVESRISKRFDPIPSGTLNPNADEIEYLQRLVKYKDSAILVLNKPPKVPVKGNLPVHNSMDALAAAALSYDYDEGPKLVHRLDRESSGLLLMGRTKESVSLLTWLFSDINKSKSFSMAWNDACEAMYQRYWTLVIGSPKEKQGIIHAPLSKVLLDDGKTERIILAQNSGVEASQEAITEYRVIGPMINGCSWMELRPLTSRKHQLRVHCAEALGTPIVGDFKYGWFVHQRWKQMPRVDIEPTTGKPYKLRRPDGLDIQKGIGACQGQVIHVEGGHPNMTFSPPNGVSHDPAHEPDKQDNQCRERPSSSDTSVATAHSIVSTSSNPIIEATPALCCSSSAVTIEVVPPQSSLSNKSTKEFKLNPGAKIFSPSFSNPISATPPAIPTVTSMAYIATNSPVLPVGDAQSEVGISPYITHSSVPGKFVPYGNFTAGNTGSAAHISQPNLAMSQVATRPTLTPHHVQFPKHQGNGAGQALQLGVPSPLGAGGLQPFPVPSHIPVLQQPIPANRPVPVPGSNGLYSTKFL